MLASSGEITEPCPVPLSLTVTTPSSMTPAFSHFWIRRIMRRSLIRCSRKRISHSWLISSKNDRMSASNMKLIFLLWIPDTESIQRVMRAAPRPESVRHSEEIFLVDRVQQRDHRPLDDLVLQRGYRERALPAIWPGYVDPPAWPRPIRSASDPVVQIFEIALKVCLVVLPRQSVHSRCRVHLEFVERVLEKIDADVVGERDELLLLPFPCDFPYALQRMWHAGLALCPGHGLLARISLGPYPWLHWLRCSWLRRRLLRSKLFHFVRRLHCCRVGGGALDCSRADLRPPHKLDVQFSRIQLSRRRSPLSGDGRDQRDKIDKPELAVELVA